MSDEVQWISNISETQFVSGPDGVEIVNEMLREGWALLSAGTNPYGDPTWLLGWNPLTAPRVKP